MILFRSLMLWIILLSSISATISPLAQENLSSIAMRMEPSIIVVLAYDKLGLSIRQGGGFFVSKNGDAITNRSILEGADHAEVRTSDGVLYPVKTAIAEDREVNLIRIGVEIPPGQVKPLLLSASLPQLGERIAVIGCRAGPERAASYGMVSAIQEIPALGQMIRVSAPISSSLNACPVVNMRGEVIGIVIPWMVEGQKFSFIIPSERVLRLNVVKEITLAEWERMREETAESLYSKGLPFLWKEEYGRALTYFNKAAKKDPRYANAYFQIGYCNSELGRYKEAIQAYQRAIEVKPDFIPAHFFLGLTYLNLRETDSALKEYKILKELGVREPDRDYANDLLNMIR